MRALRVLRERGEAVSARVRDEVGALLLADASPHGQARAAGHAQAAFDDAAGRARSLVAAPACAAGCSFCCHVHVDATGPDILAVAIHLETTLPREALEALRVRLAAHVERVEHLSDEERWAARIPCALLGDDGRCTVYAARPLACRAFHSTSAEACRDALAGSAATEPPTLAALDRLHDAVEEGYDRALLAAGLSPAPQRLESGLLAVLASERSSAW